MGMVAMGDGWWQPEWKQWQARRKESDKKCWGDRMTGFGH